MQLQKRFSLREFHFSNFSATTLYIIQNNKQFFAGSVIEKCMKRVVIRSIHLYNLLCITEMYIPYTFLHKYRTCTFMVHALINCAQKTQRIYTLLLIPSFPKFNHPIYTIVFRSTHFAL